MGYNILLADVDEVDEASKNIAKAKTSEPLAHLYSAYLQTEPLCSSRIFKCGAEVNPQLYIQ